MLKRTKHSKPKHRHAKRHLDKKMAMCRVIPSDNSNPACQQHHNRQRFGWPGASL